MRVINELVREGELIQVEGTKNGRGSIEVDGAICDDAAVCEKQLLHKLLVVSLYNVLVVIKLLVA